MLPPPSLLHIIHRPCCSRPPSRPPRREDHDDRPPSQPAPICVEAIALPPWKDPLGGSENVIDTQSPFGQVHIEPLDLRFLSEIQDELHQACSVSRITAL